MSPRHPTRIHVALVALALACSGCGAGDGSRLATPERFAWVSQPIMFSPPPDKWWREAENSGGRLGVRFVLKGGGGQCIIVAAHHQIAERDRTEMLETLLADLDSLDSRQFLKRVTRARPPMDNPVSERESQVARVVNTALDRAQLDYQADRLGFVRSDLQDALRAAQGYRPTLAELLPRMRIEPEERQEPWRWRLGSAGDSTIEFRGVHVTEDTLITPERPLIYREVHWVVGGRAFTATFQGMPKERVTFDRLVGSVTFPDVPDEARR